ncbi:MAG: hypothetical protein M3P30_15765 [Chloroflexota bacterium]|nr:hypothetical protein [Chloroflexota bacterium]
MPVQDATAANAALWSHYFENEWGRLLEPIGQQYAAQMLGAGIAGWLAIITAPQIAWLYERNAAVVSQYLAERRTRLERPVIPEDFRADQPPDLSTNSPTNEGPVANEVALSAAR